MPSLHSSDQPSQQQPTSCVSACMCTSQLDILLICLHSPQLAAQCAPHKFLHKPRSTHEFQLQLHRVPTGSFTLHIVKCMDFNPLSFQSLVQQSITAETPCPAPFPTPHPPCTRKLIMEFLGCCSSPPTPYPLPPASATPNTPSSSLRSWPCHPLQLSPLQLLLHFLRAAPGPVTPSS